MKKSQLRQIIKESIKESKLTEKEIKPIKARDEKGAEWEYCPCPDANYINCGPNCECCTEGGGQIVNPNGKNKKKKSIKNERAGKKAIPPSELKTVLKENVGCDPANNKQTGPAGHPGSVYNSDCDGGGPCSSCSPPQQGVCVTAPPNPNSSHHCCYQPGCLENIEPGNPGNHGYIDQGFEVDDTPYKPTGGGWSGIKPGSDRRSIRRENKMKKSQLRKIIKESIKQLMTEQSTGTIVHYARGCDGASTLGSMCWEGNIQVGDTMKITATSMPGLQDKVGRSYFAKDSSGPCTNITFNTIINGPNANCPSCCTNHWGGSGNHTPSGTCTLNCGSTSAGSCNPAAWNNYANFTTNFTNTVNDLAAIGPTPYPKPCNFLNQKIAQFTNSLSGGGAGGAANVWQCKLDLATQLHSQHNC